jgi:hypothetical protein
MFPMKTYLILSGYLALYRNMLKMNINENDQGHKYWMNEFAKNGSRESNQSLLSKNR